MNPHHPLLEPDRMMNPEFDFPIAYCFGDRDYNGSEGAELIVKNNKYFESGRSQVFRLDGAGHDVMWDNPYGLANYMIGFFNGTITHTMDLKTVDEAFECKSRIPQSWPIEKND